MSDISVVQDDRKRTAVFCRCGFPLLAYRIKAGGLTRMGFAARRDWRAVERGQTVDHCPKCRNDLRMTLEEFQERSAEAFRP